MKCVKQILIFRVVLSEYSNCLLEMGLGNRKSDELACYRVTVVMFSLTIFLLFTFIGILPLLSGRLWSERSTGTNENDPGFGLLQDGNFQVSQFFLFESES